MMRPTRLFRLLFPVLTVLWMTACDFPFSLKDSASPKIFVYCVPADGGTTLQVQYAAPAYGNSKTVFDFHPSVVLSIGGMPQELTEDPEKPGLLHCTADLWPGDEVTVAAFAEGVPAVSGTTTVPPWPCIRDLSWEQVRTDTLSATRVTLSLDHSPEEGEYYGLQIRTHTDAVYLEDGQPKFESTDGYSAPGQAFSNQELARVDLSDYIQVNFADGLISGWASREPLALLSAEQFDGASYSFYLNSPDLDWIYGFAGQALPGEDGWDPSQGWDPENGWKPGGNVPDNLPKRILLSETVTYRLVLYRLSKEFWYYAKAQYQSNFDFLANMGLIPANFTWSNIRDGIGMIGAVSSIESAPYIIETQLPALPEHP